MHIVCFRSDMGYENISPLDSIASHKIIETRDGVKYEYKRA